MQTGYYVALSSQVALERRLNTLADNVANAGTVGYRAGEITFDDVLTGLTAKAISFVSPGADTYNTRAGALRETGNPYDFAVQGDAWFAVESQAGPVMTRDGRFTMLETGELVTLEGYPVLDPGGTPLVLDPLAGPPDVGADGMLLQNGQPIGAIGLFAFAPGPESVRHGNSGFLANTELQPLVDMMDVGVVQGFVEESNVNPVEEMMRLIQVQRTFEQVSALMRDSDNAQKEAIKTMGV
mgnify:CR=1 FL=1